MMAAHLARTSLRHALLAMADVTVAVFEVKMLNINGVHQVYYNSLGYPEIILGYIMSW